MKVLLTGADGQVGKSLARSADPAIALLATTRPQLDIADANQVDRVVADASPDLIINAAAYTAVDRAETEPEQAHAVNETGVANLAAAAARCGARLIHISTDFVFDGRSASPYRPDDTPAPLGVYGASKLAGEQAALATLQDNAVTLRTAWVYASRGHNFVLTMLRLMHEHGSVRVVSDQIGSPTASHSIADAIWAISARPELNGIYHWTDSGVASWYDFAVAVSEEALSCGLLSSPVTVSPIATEDYPTAAQRPSYSVLDTRTTIDAIGISPLYWRSNLRNVLKEIKLG